MVSVPQRNVRVARGLAVKYLICHWHLTTVFVSAKPRRQLLKAAKVSIFYSVFSQILIKYFFREFFEDRFTKHKIRYKSENVESFARK